MMHFSNNINTLQLMFLHKGQGHIFLIMVDSLGRTVLSYIRISRKLRSIHLLSPINVTIQMAPSSVMRPTYTKPLLFLKEYNNID